MNYLAHGRHFLDWPYLLAGTAVPDWLNVVDRRVRTRSRSASRWLHQRDGRVVQVAAGIVRHHKDDAWFHRQRAFAELSWQFTVAIRDRLPADDGLRPSFLGHILVELLLDDELSRRRVGLLERYYQAVAALDTELVAWVVGRIANRPAPQLAYLIPRFSAVRFLYDYAEDAKLLLRLNNVMHRVGLSAIPDSLTAWLPIARQQVHARFTELLPDEASECASGCASDQ